MTGAPRTALAPAKINLCLHVTGRRPDGYHAIDTLVVFADAHCADRLTLVPAQADAFRIEGSRAAELDEADPSANLVIGARDWLRARAGGRHTPPVALTLNKALPVASGVGGGSADAAAALRLLADHWGFGPGWLDAHAASIAHDLGADIPMCLAGRAARARGIGERLDAVAGLPPLPAVLVNPGVAIATPAAFAGLARRDNPPMPSPPRGAFSDVASLADWLSAHTRNDLEGPASARVPQIGGVLTALRDAGARLARMSGSGATCFGLFDTMDAAQAAQRAIAPPGWWVRASRLNAPHNVAATQEVAANA